MKSNKSRFLICIFLSIISVASADPFADAVRSFLPEPAADYGHDAMPGIVLGPPEGGGAQGGSKDAASLGCGGEIILEFTDNVIYDGPGVDFIVFENPFLYAGGEEVFAETAQVAVSFDCIAWFSFEMDYDSTAAPPGDRWKGMAGITPVYSNSENGIDPADPSRSGGDAFDLADVGLERARFIRITDTFGMTDKDGDLIEDPGDDYGCLQSASGFDLDAVVAVHSLPVDPSPTPAPSPTVGSEEETFTASIGTAESSYDSYETMQLLCSLEANSDAETDLYIAAEVNANYFIWPSWASEIRPSIAGLQLTEGIDFNGAIAAVPLGEIASPLIVRWHIALTDPGASSVLCYNAGATELKPGNPTPTLTPAPMPTPTPIMYGALILNGLSETIARIGSGPTPRTVEKNAGVTGQAPNRIVVRGGKGYIVNSLSNSIQIIDVETLHTEREVSTGAGTNPYDLDFYNDRIAVVSLWLTNEAGIVDFDSGGKTMTTVALPSSDELPRDEGEVTQARPQGVAVVGDIAYVALTNLNDSFTSGGPGVVALIDIPSETLLSFFETTGRNAGYIGRAEDYPDLLFISNSGSHDLDSTGYLNDGSCDVYSISENRIIRSIPLDGAPMKITPGRGGIVYFANGSAARVLSADIETGEVLQPIDLPTSGEKFGFVSGAAFGPDGLLWAVDFNSDNLYIFDTLNGNRLVEGPFEVGDGPGDIWLDVY